MFGLALRITLLLISLLAAVVLITAGAFYLQRQADVGIGPRFPLPDQLAAIVELIEATPPEQRSLVLRAINSPDLRVSLRQGSLPATVGESEFPSLAWMTQRYLSALGERRVHAGASDDGASESGESARFGDGLRRRSPMLQVQVELHDGQIVLIELRGGLLQRVLGRRLAWAAVLAILLTTLLALWSVRRQIRPLETLADAVERFGTPAEGPPLRESGAQETRRLVIAYNRMRERIHALVDGRTRMLAAISHDLGTYLTRLRLRIEYIGDASQRERAERDLADMHQLLRDTLTLGRMEQATDRRELFDLAVLAAHHVHAYHEAGAAVMLQASTPQWVAGNAAALGRVLTNLIDNALKFGGSAELSLLRDGAMVELRVEDRGPGIAESERELVLEPFYRLDDARNLDHPGSGLGLAIVADILRRHGGRLRLEERPGGGLRACACLPLA